MHRDKKDAQKSVRSAFKGEINGLLIIHLLNPDVPMVREKIGKGRGSLGKVKGQRARVKGQRSRT